MSNSLSQGQFVRHSAWTLGQQLSGTLVSLCTTVLMARMLGPAGQGLYGVVATTAMLGGLCINLGTPAATTYVVSRRQIAPVRALKYSVAITVLLGGTGAMAIGMLMALCPQRLWPSIPPHQLVWAAALIPVLLAVQLLAAILQGAHAFARYNTMALIAPCVTLVSTVLALSWGGGVGAALGCLLLGQMTGVAWGVISIRRFVRLTPQPDEPMGLAHWRAYLTSLLAFGALAALANALAYSSYRIDIFLLSAWLPREAVGYYSVAASIAERLWMLSGAINMVLFAQVARSHSVKQRAPVENHTPMLTRHVLWLVTAAAVGLYFVAPSILPLLFGASYAQSIAPLNALLPGVVVFNVSRILSQDLAGRGLVWINVWVGAACLGLNVVGNIVLIPAFGTVGAAWASTLSYSADTLFKLIVYTRLTRTPLIKLVWLQPEDWRRMKLLKP